MVVSLGQAGRKDEQEKVSTVCVWFVRMGEREEGEGRRRFISAESLVAK